MALLHAIPALCKWLQILSLENATDFTFHDLKAKGISDYKGTMADKQRFSGHKDIPQVSTYDRKPDIVPMIGSESISK